MKAQFHVQKEGIMNINTDMLKEKIRNKISYIEYKIEEGMNKTFYNFGKNASLKFHFQSLLALENDRVKLKEVLEIVELITEDELDGDTIQLILLKYL